MPIETPEYVIGCGGNSSGIVERLMKKEWLLEETVTKDRKLKAITVDSATGNAETAQRAQTEDEIQGLIENYADKAGQTFTQVEFEHYNYVLNTAEGTTETSFLTNEQDIKDLFQYSPVLENSWWIEDDDAGDLLSGGFNNGVQRRRALSKALYHVSSVNNNSEKTHPQNLNVSANDDVVMVVSLGGGTGSGTFLDIAQDLNPDATIHLFAVIPDAGHGNGASDGSDELASAYAALSELEYLEVSGQSPFHNIVLLPYLEQSGISDEDFENGVISSILSYLDLVNDDNGNNHITPGRANSINDYYPFVLSMPRIIEYDAGRREEAQADVNEYLKTRQEQLRVERGTYETVEHYLQHNFQDSFGETLEVIRGAGGQTDAGLRAGTEEEDSHLISLMVRLEDELQGKLLRDDNLKVAGADVDDFFTLFEEMYAAQMDLTAGPSEDTPPYERIEEFNTDSPQYAEKIVSRLPVQIQERIQPQTFDDPIDEQIAALLVSEAQNVQQRAALLGAISSTETDEVEGLEPEEVKDIKSALIDVILDPDSYGLVDEFPQDGLSRIRDSLWDSVGNTELQHARLSRFNEALQDHLEETLDNWWNGTAEDERRTITTYTSHRSELDDLLHQLDDACRQKANQLSRDTVEAERVSLRLSVNDSEVDLSRINELLEDLGVEERINRDEIINQIRNLKQAKKARAEYSGGISSLLGGSDEYEHQFSTATRSVNEEGNHFEIIFDDIEEPFNVEYRYDFTTLLETVDDRYDEAVDTVVEQLETSLMDNDGHIKTYHPSEFVEVDEVVTVLENDGTVPKPKRLIEEESGHSFTVPSGDEQVNEALSEIERTLRSLNEEDISSDFELGQHLGVAQIVNYRSAFDDATGTEWEPETPVENLVEAYLSDIWARTSELEDELNWLGSSYLDDTNTGLYQSLERLIRLADTRSTSPSDQGLPLTHQGSNTQHGPDLTETYEDFFEIPSTENREPRDDNVFRRTQQADNRDLVDNPNDISESRVWANKQDEIIEELVESVRVIRDNDDDRNPVSLNQLNPQSDDVSSQLAELRLINAYSSRDFERSDADPTAGGDEVTEIREMSKSGLFGTLLHEKDGYLEKMADFGDPWTYTLVTYLTGFTLDMLVPVTDNDGYASTYEVKHNGAEYPWRNHSLGLAGDWDRVPELADKAGQAGDDWWPTGGAFVYRDPDDLYPPSKISEWTLQTKNQGLERSTVKKRIEDAYTIQTFPSFIDFD